MHFSGTSSVTLKVITDTKNMSNISWNYLCSIHLIVSDIVKQKAASVTEFL